MDVLLINPPDELEAMFGVGRAFIQKFEPLGLLYVAAVARQRGHQVAAIDANAEGLEVSELKARIIRHAPAVVGISTLTCSGAIVYELGQHIRRMLPQTKVVLGNIHASVFAGAYLDAGCCDAVVHGEGEYVFAAILDALESGLPLTGIPSVSCLDHDGRVVRTGPAAVVDDLTRLPPPARDLVDQSFYRYSPIDNHSYVDLAGGSYKTIITSRGCPFRCGFCAVHGGRGERFDTPERVVDEFEMLHRQYGASYVYVFDALFMGDIARAIRICDLLRRQNLPLRWSCNAHVNLITPELVAAMAGSGCHELALGIESGVQARLDQVGKRTTTERIRRAVATIRAHSDIQIEGMFILGLPGESRDETLATIRFARSLRLDMAQFSVFCPYPGSPLFDELAAGGQIDTGLRPDGTLDPTVWRRYTSYLVFNDNPPIWVTPALDAAELRRLQKRALREFYLTPRQLWRQARRLRPGNLAQMARIALRGLF